MTSSENARVPGTAVITGASSGIGRAYADRFAARGHDLLLVARRGDRLETAATELRRAHGIEVSTLVADLSDPLDRARTAERISSDPKISVLVNNAGTATIAAITDMKLEQAVAMLQVNTLALTELALAIVPRFKAQGRGTIINVGSVLGFAAIPMSSVYSGTKAFVHLFTRGLQDELRGSGVRVHLMLQSATATEIWENAGFPLPPGQSPNVMTIEDCVDAAMAGLDAGEAVTMPSVDRADLLEVFDTARVELFKASQTGTPATRYGIVRRSR